uniref:AP2-like ethylene-responsive transcription factor TOE3 n=1 Tax=Rhizophora mucronata TaxID=61149 RepID=A0A2P2J2R3_RHIMU
MSRRLSLLNSEAFCVSFIRMLTIMVSYSIRRDQGTAPMR